MASLGFYEEHKRPDRDAYVTVQEGEIAGWPVNNFDVLWEGVIDYENHNYDVSSVMQWDGTVGLPRRFGHCHAIICNIVVIAWGQTRCGVFALSSFQENAKPRQRENSPTRTSYTSRKRPPWVLAIILSQNHRMQFLI